MNLEILQKMIDRELDKILPLSKEEPRQLHRAMRYSVFSGGKRLRPTITVEAARSCGGAAGNALSAACAVELIHTYSLIHDDLPAMDDDDIRRGSPSCHKAFGEANAILAGDALLTLAFEVIAERHSPVKASAMVKALSRAAGVVGMIAGQAMDIQAGSKGKKTLDRIDRLKTGRLFEAAAVLGAICAGASKTDVRALKLYGGYFGAAFQVADDISDLDRYMNDAEKKTAASFCRKTALQAKRAVSRFGLRAGGLMALADGITKNVDRWINC